jgi:hypothetical protein
MLPRPPCSQISRPEVPAIRAEIFPSMYRKNLQEEKKISKELRTEPNQAPKNLSCPILPGTDFERRSFRFAELLGPQCHDRIDVSGHPARRKRCSQGR